MVMESYDQKMRQELGGDHILLSITLAATTGGTADNDLGVSARSLDGHGSHSAENAEPPANVCAVWEASLAFVR